MPSKPAAPSPLTGIAAELAAIPRAATPRGGEEFGFKGEEIGDPLREPTEVEQPQNPFAGLGPLLEADDKTAYEQANELVLRQELIAQNHLAQDIHWTLVKLGYPWSELTKEPNRDVYKQSLPYGASAIRIQAVPNKVWDLCNKTTESLLADFPQGEAEPDDDSEEAQNACDMANRFLAEDGGEQGTNDAVLFHDRVGRAMTCATTYLECWSDPTGGGYVPLQINAHPQAVDPNNPLVDAQGQPTTDHILRYVTQSPGPDGTFPEGTQFTTNPAAAAPQWQPKLRAAKWNREHIRVFPETATVENAEKVIILGYCTLGEAKRRWKKVATMTPEQLSALCDWTPTRYLVLLPPYLRSRWALTDGQTKQKAGSSDERIMFYYHVYARACPDYRKGADVVLTGVNGGLVLDRKLLAKEVPAKLAPAATPGQELASADAQAPIDGAEAAPAAASEAHEVRCLEIPVVQVTPRGDPDECDPTGRAYVEMIAGAAEHNAFMAQSYAELVDKILHTPFATPSTSPIEGWQVEEARATGDFLIMETPGDLPKQLDPPREPQGFFRMYELSDEAINSIASQERAAQGSESSKERSGKALQIAVARNNVSLSGMQTAVNNAVARWDRIKIEQAMANFTTPQQISYIGEDGAYKQDDLKGVDLARVGKVTIKAGTGTGMDQDTKVQYLGNLRAGQMIDEDEAREAARPSFARRLGLPDNPHEQYASRCIDAWLKGPPSEEWLQQFQTFEQQKAAYTQALSVHIQQTGQQPTPGGPPPDVGVPMPQAPWTPFTPRPNDDEPHIAAIWVRKLSRVISSVKYSEFPPEWRKVLDEKYRASRQVADAARAMAAQPQQKQPAQAA